MPLYKANRNFVGRISMHLNEVREINDSEVEKDLLNAGYIELVNTPKKEVKVNGNSKKSKPNNSGQSY